MGGQGPWAAGEPEVRLEVEPLSGPSPGATVTMTQLLWLGAAITMTQLLWLQPCILPSPQRAPRRAGWPHGGPRSPGQSARLATSPSLQQRARATSEDNQAPPPEKWEQEVGEGSRLAQEAWSTHCSAPSQRVPHLLPTTQPRHPGTQAPEPGNVAFCYSGMFPLCPSTLGLVSTTGGCSFQSGPHGEGFPKNRNLRDRPLHAPAPPSPAQPTDLLSPLAQSLLLPPLLQ